MALSEPLEHVVDGSVVDCGQAQVPSALEENEDSTEKCLRSKALKRQTVDSGSFTPFIGYVLLGLLLN